MPKKHCHMPSLDGISFKPTPKFMLDHRYPDLRCYVVLLEGKPIGTVESFREESWR